MALLLFIFFIFPFALIALALNASWICIAGTVFFLLFLTGFDTQMKRQLIRELNAQELPPDHPRTVSIARMIETYAPDDYRMRVKFRVYAFPSSEPELRLWMTSKWRFELFVSEGFFDRSTENDWIHFLQGWSTLKWSMIRRQNRLRALNSMFDRWKGPVNVYRHWWVSFWLYPLERVLKISKI